MRHTLATILLAFAVEASGSAQERGSPEIGLWVHSTEILALAPAGAAWDAMASAGASLGSLDLSDQDDPDDSRLLAAAIVAVRLGQDVRPLRAVALAAMGTEDGGRTLALGRNLPCLVFAVDLIGLPADDDARFRTWLAGVRTEQLDGRTLVSTDEERGNNWRCWAGAARVAASAYLGDWQDVRRAALVQAGWMGVTRAYAGFEYGDLDWQSDPAHPVGILPPGATIQGHNLDGAQPEELRRAGGFTWPPPKENYCWEALQGVVVELVVLERVGIDLWGVRQRAPLRAMRWLHAQANYPAEGDDGWIPYVINAKYGTSFPAPVPSRHGKGPGFTDWISPVGN